MSTITTVMFSYISGSPHSACHINYTYDMFEERKATDSQHCSKWMAKAASYRQVPKPWQTAVTSAMQQPYMPSMDSAHVSSTQ